MMAATVLFVGPQAFCVGEGGDVMFCGILDGNDLHPLQKNLEGVIKSCRRAKGATADSGPGKGVSPASWE